MARSQNYVVRVSFKVPEREKLIPCNHENQFSMLIEFLRYAGILTKVEETEEKLVIDIFPPTGVHSPTWAKMNAERIRSFLVKAEVIQKY